MGKVYLIGAGCGGYDLMTQRGIDLLKKADCVLYDRLIDPLLLQLVPAHCECINVGKENHHHTMPQTKIEETLIEKASRYERVIRLKGGDPYVFGRGGEEVLALTKANIDFEVVPGISSSIAALTYAGIPITQRGINRGFRVYSAHTKDDEINDLDYRSMACSSDTLVFLMGLKHKQEVFQGLLDHGKAKDTPIALISNGARYNQKSIYSTLQEALNQDFDMESPCTIVVGDVVALHEQMDFYTSKPLLHKRILIPNLDHHLIGEDLREAGAMVEEVQVGEIEEYKNALADIDIMDYSCILFTSRHGVSSFFHSLMEKGCDTRCLSHIKFACIGEKTAKELREFGILSDIICAQSDSWHMAELLKQTISKDECILLAKADNDNTILQEALSDYDVHVVAMYHTIMKPFTTTYEHYDAMMASSAFHVKACKDLFAHIDTIFSIGPHTTIACRKYGAKHIIESKTADKKALLSLIKEELK